MAITFLKEKTGNLRKKKNLHNPPGNIQAREWGERLKKKGLVK